MSVVTGFILRIRFIARCSWSTLDISRSSCTPCGLPVVRIESGEYSNPKLQTCHTDGYTVVLAHDVEKPKLFAQLAKLPMLDSLEPINRLELPARTEVLQPMSRETGQNPPVSLSQLTDLTSSLRTAAAMVHADMLLIYTLDDVFDDRDLFELGTVATLGLSPNKSLTVTSTASAVCSSRENMLIPENRIEENKRTDYYVCTAKAMRPNHWWVYPLPLRKSLPTILIPCRETDADVPLALQPIIDQDLLGGRA